MASAKWGEYYILTKKDVATAVFRGKSPVMKTLK